MFLRKRQENRVRRGGKKKKKKREVVVAELARTKKGEGRILLRVNRGGEKREQKEKPQEFPPHCDTIGVEKGSKKKAGPSHYLRGGGKRKGGGKEGGVLGRAL